MITLIIALNTATLTILGWMFRAAVKYKAESNKWKTIYAERLTALEQQLKDRK